MFSYRGYHEDISGVRLRETITTRDFPFYLPHKYFLLFFPHLKFDIIVAQFLPLNNSHLPLHIHLVVWLSHTTLEPRNKASKGKQKNEKWITTG